MKKEDFLWMIWGILISFTLQVSYDASGEFPNFTSKVWYGLLIAGVSFLILIIYVLIIAIRKN
jgi:hypothetical protein